MNLNYLIYIMSVVCGVLALVAPKIANYVIGLYLVMYGVIKLMMVLS